MYYHKLALCHEQLGQREEAYAALEKALAAPLGTAPLGTKTDDPKNI